MTMTAVQTQHALNVLSMASPPLLEDGKFGALSAGALKNFQRAHGGLVVDGVPGPNTWDALQTALDRIGATDVGADYQGPGEVYVAPGRAAAASTLGPVLPGFSQLGPAAVARVVSLNIPAVSAVPATMTTPAISALAAHTVHVTTATGATSVHPLGTPAPTAWNPATWNLAEKLAAVAAGAVGLFGLRRLLVGRAGQP